MWRHVAIQYLINQKQKQLGEKRQSTKTDSSKKEERKIKINVFREVQVLWYNINMEIHKYMYIFDIKANEIKIW